MLAQDAFFLDWSSVQLVVFDMDGTLYDQRTVRHSMLRLLLADALSSRSLRTLRVLRTFRRLRESLAEQEAKDFLRLQYELTAEREGISPALVRELTERWMEVLPLRYLAGARYEAVDRLFDRLRRSGRKIAIWSDYPAVAKLQALALSADLVCCANDPGIAALKPSPNGLVHIMERTGLGPQETLLIGDRVERDGAAARRVGTRALIRTSSPAPGFDCFDSFAAPLFDHIE